MRRWNGWGLEGTTYPLPKSAIHYLEETIGRGSPTPDVPFERVLTTVPASHLPSHPLITTDPAERVFHARGQSLPDWVALRSGQIEAFPQGVAYPTNEDDVRALLEYGHQTGVKLIPYGGGTSVVGHINPLPSETPTVTMNLKRLHRLLDLDGTSQLATFEAGVSGPDLEEQLRSNGYTLGHFPQSWELSTLGGWIATRSTGQQSLYYGRIENLFAGGHLETPIGPLELSPSPASAAGPDLREMVLGSEGRLGVITRAVVRVRPLPTSEHFYAAFFREWEVGVRAVRAIVQDGVRPSMLRLSDGLETRTTLALSGNESLVAIGARTLRLLRYGDEPCMLIYGVTGDRMSVAYTKRRIASILRSHGGLLTGKTIGMMWQKSRFHTPYLRNTLWEHGFAVDTLETAVSWSEVLPITDAVLVVLRNGLAECEEGLLAFAHVSHVYRDGASVYITFIFRRAIDPMQTLQRWKSLKAAASEVLVSFGATISHQHGVGMDHSPYLAAEKGDVGMSMLEAIRRRLDPERLLNPGKLLRDV